MSKTIRILLGIGLIVASVLVSKLLVYLRPKAKPADRSTQALVVEVSQILPETKRLLVQAHGTLKPRISGKLAAEIGGRVVSISEDLLEGNEFKEGEELLKLDAGDYLYAISQAKLSLSNAEVALERERLEGEIAAKEFESNPEPSPLALRIPQLKAAEASVAAAKASLAKARRDYSRTSVKAPYDLKIQEKFVGVGSFVSRGGAVAEVYSVASAIAKVELSSSDFNLLDLELLRTKPKVKIKNSDSLDDRTWEGAVVAFDSMLDPKSRSIKLSIEIEDPFNLKGSHPAGPLLPGSYIRVDIEGKEMKDLVRVPKDSLKRFGETTQVLLAGPDSKLLTRPATVVQQVGDHFYVQMNFEESEKLIVTSVPYAKEGLELTIQD